MATIPLEDMIRAERLHGQKLTSRFSTSTIGTMNSTSTVDSRWLEENYPGFRNSMNLNQHGNEYTANKARQVEMVNPVRMKMHTLKTVDIQKKKEPKLPRPTVSTEKVHQPKQQVQPPPPTARRPQTTSVKRTLHPIANPDPNMHNVTLHVEPELPDPEEKSNIKKSFFSKPQGLGLRGFKSTPNLRREQHNQSQMPPSAPPLPHSKSNVSPEAFLRATEGALGHEKWMASVPPRHLGPDAYMRNTGDPVPKPPVHRGSSTVNANIRHMPARKPVENLGGRARSASPQKQANARTASTSPDRTTASRGAMKNSFWSSVSIIPKPKQQKTIIRHVQ